MRKSSFPFLVYRVIEPFQPFPEIDYQDDDQDQNKHASLLQGPWSRNNYHSGLSITLVRE